MLIVQSYHNDECQVVISYLIIKKSSRISQPQSSELLSIYQYGNFNNTEMEILFYIFNHML